MYSYLDTPLDPYGDYGEQEKELERQRQLALALYKNVIGGANANAQATGPYNGIAAFLGQALGGLGAQSSERDFAARQAEIDRNKAAAESKFYASMPQTKPGRPEVDIPSYATGLPPWAVGTDSAMGDVPVQSKMLPQVPSDQEMAKYYGSAPRTPEAQKFALKGMESLLPEPLSRRYHETPEGVFDSRLGEWLPNSASPAHMEVVKERQRILEEAADQRYEVAKQNAKTAAEKAAADDDYKRERLEILRAVADNKGIGRMVPAEGTSVEGNPLMRNSITGTQHEVINGIPSSQPYSGSVISKGEQKNVAEVSSVLNDARMARDLADKVHTKPEVFSTRANVMNTVSGLAGGLGRESMTGLSPEDLQLRGVVMRDFAATTKQLYGASFTQSEQARANSFVPQSNDSAAVIEQKLRGAATFNEEMAQKYGGKILGAAQARTGGNAAPLRDNFAPGTDSPGMAEYHQQQERAGKTTPMLPQLGGKTVVRTGRTPDGRRAVQYSDGTVEIQ